MGRRIEEREADLMELLDVLFRRASEELDGYEAVKEKLGKERAERQRAKYLGIYEVIEDGGYMESFKEYREMVKKERSV